MQLRDIARFDFVPMHGLRLDCCEKCGPDQDDGKKEDACTRVGLLLAIQRRQREALKMVRQAKKTDLGRSNVKHKYDSAINRLGDSNNTEAIGADDTNQHRSYVQYVAFEREARIPIMSHFMFQLQEQEEHIRIAHSWPENHPKINARTRYWCVTMLRWVSECDTYFLRGSVR